MFTVPKRNLLQNNLFNPLLFFFSTLIQFILYFLQFDLVCDREHLASLSQSLTIAGQGIGVLLTTPLADRLGRKVVLVSSNLGMLICGLLIALSQNVTMFIIFKFCVGGFQQVGIMAIICTYY